MEKSILLVEPGYKTKFPPLGLMKISAYHKKMGDRVKFIKGINYDVAYEFWDRVYIATLFTYHWKVTIDTILYYKTLVGGDHSRIVIGGILASLMPDEIWRTTGIAPQRGILNTPGILDDGNDYVIDEMIPDYNLFEDSSHTYFLVDDTYFGYSTRGCVHQCKFCGVPKLEPEFIEYKNIKPYVRDIKTLYGEKQHLVLFDNNILASKKFSEIISDIKELGFEAGAKLNGRKRKVDFNQGTDARFITKKVINNISKISLSPLRIAFDSIKFKKIYVRAVLLAADKGIHNLSNYILYNYNDTPEDFWQRLKINIDLNQEYGLKIYSFPMKYIPLNSKDRSYINEPSWNWYFIRSVQRILNVLKGTVMTGQDFFNRAFGENIEKFITILHMPESILMHRGAKPKYIEKIWFRKFYNLTKIERKELLEILCENRTKKKLIRAVVKSNNRKVKEIIDYYLI